MFFIYNVIPGDSLFSIATKFGVPLNTIQNINRLENGILVPGQDIVIPSSTYIVQPGDSLYTISQNSFIPVQTLRSANGLTSDLLTVGMRLYLPPRTKYVCEGLSYLYPTTPQQDELIIRTFAPINTYFGIFEYHILQGGGLSTLNDEFAIQTSRNNRIAPLATITNLTPEGFSLEITRQVLTSPEQRNRLINNIYQLVRSKNYYGVNVDFERVREEERDLYTGFLRALGERLRPEGYSLSVAVPPKTSDDIPWLKGYDYGGIGAVVDFMFIMAYDWSTPDTPPGPVAPINEVRRTIEYALQQMRGRKIILGVPRYGYNWTMDNGNVVSGRAVSVAGAINLASRYQVPIQYSSEYEQPYFTYIDENGRRHIVWYENARSRTAKLKLVEEYRLRGMGAWQLGLDFPQSAFIVNELFIVRKVI
ncbi:glycosyl hydrolase family 18 protein [Cytobacillus firmus]|uniref:glycosyl hydrolase family 18 protein n=1 Tax=Cytobacillus firmus TaxID=1399 RepID=UPI002228192F|nr:glycosyl hydrolase family 18 protein [Cytobacillus firmus]